MRVVWLVQLLDDDLDTQIVHTYPEEWVLTGLGVREDHGLDIAVLFEDPAQESGDALKADDRLWKVADGLQQTFVRARDQDNDKKRDITIAEIKNRFDNQSNGSVSTEKLWGIPRDALRVQTYQYDHQDYIAKIPSEITPKILKDHFTANGSAVTDAPTLLFAREEHYRSASLDMVDGVIAVSGSQVTVNMAADKISLDTLAAMNWGPYRYRNSRWEPYPISEYRDKLEVTLKDLFKKHPPLDESGQALYTPNDPDADDIVAGLVTAAQAYYFSMELGETGIPASGTALATARVAYGTSDASLAHQIVNTVGGGIEIVADGLVETFTDTLSDLTKRQAALKDLDELPFADPGSLSRKGKYKLVGLAAKEGVQSKFKSLADPKKMASGGIAVAALGFSIAGSFSKNKDLQKVTLGLGVAGTTLDMINTVKDLSGLAGSWTSFKGLANKMAAASKNISRASMYAGAALTIIAIGVTIGFFIAAWAAGGYGSFLSLQFTAAVADTIATVVAITILFAISLIPVIGQIIAAVIGLVDAVINFICSFLSDDQKNSVKTAQGGFKFDLCGGLSGFLTEAIRWNIFSQNSLVGNLHKNGRMNVADFDFQPVDVEQGYSVGSDMKYNMSVANIITLADVPIDWKAAVYAWQYTYANLDSATFRYLLRPGKQEEGEIKPPEDGVKGVARNQMEDDWERGVFKVDGEDALYNKQRVSGNSALAEAGINRPANLYLTETYAAPTQECWVVPIPPAIPPVPFVTLIPVCHIRTEDNTNHTDLGKTILWDVFPDTLDEFYACKGDVPNHACHKESGFSLAWGQVGDVTFPRMKDFDGDGLLNKADGGSDPDDSRWDSDADGLSDLFESQEGTDPSRADSDGDGLSDYDEVRLGTNPNRMDSDGDGLTDKEELDGWEFVYALAADGSQLKTWVTSDPLSIDADGDELTDFQEKVFGFHPGVASDSTILSYESKVREPGAPVMLLRFEETAGATAFSDVSGDINNGICEGDGCPAAGHTGRYGNALVFDGADDVVSIKSSDTLTLANRSFTVAFWARRSAANRWDIAIGQGVGSDNQGLHIGFRNNNKFTCAFYGNDLDTSAPYTDSDWHHWACTYDAGSRTQTIYRDGANVAQRTASAHYQGAGDLWVGKAPWGAHFSGRLDEVAVFAKALSQAEIEAVRDARYNYNDGIVKPGDTLTYTGTAENHLLNRYANGLLTTDFPAGLDNAVPPASFILQPGERQELSGNVTVKSGVSSGKATLAQVAGGIIVDRREESGYAQLWLPFGEGSGASTFYDFSGNVPARNATCSGSSCPQAGQSGISGTAVQFDGSDDSLNAGNRIDLANKSFTVAFWVKRDATGRNMFIVGQGERNNYKGLHVGFNADNQFICGFYGDDITGPTIIHQEWQHWACTYDAATGIRTLYQEGMSYGYNGSRSHYQGTGDFYVGKAPWGDNFSGAVDDLRVYDRALSADEIARLAGRPVYQVDLSDKLFDGTYYYENTRSYVIPSLDNARFTLSAWVKPTPRGWLFGGAYDNHPQGILGKNAGQKDAFPTLLAVGKKVRFGFGDGSDWRERTSGDVLTLNAWNHLVATFDQGAYRLYVNGVERDHHTFSSQQVAYAYDPTIGRASNRASVYLDHLQITDEADGSGNAELCIAWRDRRGGAQREIWNQGDVDVGDHDVKQSLDLSEEGYLRIWEDDGGTRCGANQDDGDDFVWDRKFTTNDPAISGKQNPYTDRSDDTKAHIWLGNDTTPAFSNFSIPFRGAIGQVAIYKRVMGAEEVQTFYASSTLALHLRFDDPPGVGLSGQGFADATDPTGQRKGTCSASPPASGGAGGGSCPTSGVSGVANQAALFDGSDDYVDAGSGIDLANKSFTVAFWAKRNAANRWDMAIGQGTDSNNRGLHLGFRDNNTFTCDFYGNGLDTSSAYTDTNWHYWACTYEAGTKTRTIYRDGVQVAQDTASATYQGTGNLWVGKAPWGAHFGGLLDDVRVYRRALAGYEIWDDYAAAPWINLSFDEAEGATKFYGPNGAAQTAYGECVAPHCPTSGNKGQLGLSVEFDGEDDYVSLHRLAQAMLEDDSFTVMAWVRGNDFAKNGDNAILGTDTRSNNKGLHLAVRNSKPYMGFYGNDMGANTELRPNYWYHLTWRYDKDRQEQAIFVNGYLDKAETGHAPFQGTGWPETGQVYVGKWGGDSNYFSGRIDELAIYGRALSQYEIRDIFRYQGRWVEERQSHEITIDADSPTSSLRSYQSGQDNYRANQDVVLDIEAADTTSRVALAELGVKKDGQSGFIWIGAPECQDISPLVGGNEGGAWCPTFDPADFGGEGTYTLQTRATDAAGNREMPSTSYTLYVDGTPPSIGPDTAEGDLLVPQRHATQPDTWKLALSGTVSDPTLSSGAAGSGVNPESVQVTLLDAEGNSAGAGMQLAAVTGSQWAVDYLFYDANPTGVYTLTVQAEDRMGNRATRSVRFHLDASPPGAELDLNAAPANVISDTLTLQGGVQDVPSLPGAVVRLHLDEAAGAQLFIDSSGRKNNAVCSGSACPSAGQAGQFGRALQFDGNDTVTLANTLAITRTGYTVAAWFRTGAAAAQTLFAATTGGNPGIRLQLGSDGKARVLHRFPTGTSGGAEVVSGKAYNDNAWHHLAAVKSGASLTVYVDGASAGTAALPVEGAEGGATLTVALGQSFSGLLDEVQVYDRALAVSDVRALGQSQVSGVAGVEVAFTPLSGSAPFYRATASGPALPAGQLLYLPLDDVVDANGNLKFEDKSGNGRTGSCDGKNCPTAGVPGRIGTAAQFDGADDAVSAGSGINLANTSFTVAFWAKRNAAGRWDMAIGQGTDRNNRGLHLGFRGNNTFTCDFYGNGLDTPATYTDTDWHHWACTYDASTRTRIIYRDGVKVAQGTTSAHYQGSGDFRLGRSPWKTYFSGALDDVRVFDSSLTAEQVNQLYQYRGGSGELHLPFEQRFAADGAILPNAADDTRPATLHSGSAENRVVPGAVGNFALQLDGVDDSLSVENGADLTGEQLSVCLWVRPEAGNAAGAVIAQRWGSSGYNWALRRGSSGFAWQHSAISGSSNVQSGALVAGRWYHLCGVSDGTRQLLYVDGQKVNAGWTNSAAGSGAGVSLGRQVGSSANYFKGAIDEVRLYPRAISSDEVKALYHSGWQPAGYPAQTGAVTQTSEVWQTSEVSDERAAAGISCQTYTSSDTPVAINDYQTSTSSISVPDTFKVDDINLTVNIQHTYDGDLSGYLIAPNNAQVTLFNRRGSWRDNYTNTQFDDEAATLISNGSAPFSGPFRPESPLSALHGQPAQGTWQFRVRDQAGGDQGQILNWSLELCTVSLPAPASDWTLDVPAGLEGNYRVDLRGADTAGLTDDTTNSGNAWFGEIDTLAPRVSISRTVVGDKYRFTSTAEDYNLSPAQFTSICGAGVFSQADEVPGAEDYDDVQRLFRLTAQCEFDVPPLEEVGVLDTDGEAINLALVGNRLYVADYREGLRVLDVSDPTQPSEVGHFKEPYLHETGGVYVSGNYAYVNDYYSELRILDVADPAAIGEVGSYSFRGGFSAKGVPGVKGNYLYLPNASERKLQILDISDPTNPTGAGVKDLAVGQYHTCALMHNGTVKCWGRNVDGQLGNGSIANAVATLVQVKDIDNAVAIAAGEDHTCAVLETGRVKCWGEGQNGQLGIGYFSGDQTTPVDVVNIDNAVAIAAGFRHTCIIDSEEDVWCWGYNGYGQLGDGSSTSERASPVKVTGLASSAQAITAGGDHTCVIDNWRAKCWGDNSSGQLGDGTTTNRSTPVNVTNGYGMTDIAAGAYHTCAIKSEQAQCWGSGGDGRLGNGSTSSSLTPVNVTNGSNVEAIEAGIDHTCAKYSINGWFRCWGDNWLGQLGDGTRNDSSVPVDVVGSPWADGWGERVTHFGGGYQHSCAATTTGVKCWGYRSNGQLGDGYIDGNWKTPVDVLNMPADEVDMPNPGSGSGPEKVVVVGNYAYVTAQFNGLIILDVSTPNQPRVLSQYTGPITSWRVPYAVNDVAISGNYAYLAKSWEGLVVLDISNKSNPVKVGHFNPPNIHMAGVSLSGTYAYMVDSYGGVWLIDIVNPRSPSRIRDYHLDMKYSAVAGAGNYAYVAAREDGVRVAYSDLRPATESVTACDTFGHCVTKSITETNSLRLLGLAQSTPAVAISLVDEPDSILRTTDPLTLTGSVQSTEYLQSLIASIDSAPIYSETWSADTITTTLFSFGWTPPGEGEYLLDITATGWLTGTASYTQTITVDATPPQLTIAGDVLTSTHAALTGEILLTGSITDTTLNYIDVTISDGLESVTGRATVEGNAWTYTWETGQAAPPDNLAYTVYVTATDRAGWQTAVQRDVTVDVVAPAPVQLAVSSEQGAVNSEQGAVNSEQGAVNSGLNTEYAVLQAQTVITPGDTIREISPTLTLTWTVSSSKDVARYQVGWIAQTSAVTQTSEVWQTSEVSDERAAVQTFSGEAQKLTVQLAGEDTLGNQRWQSFGPIYVDSPLTPDYVSLPSQGRAGEGSGVYRGWMDSGCTLIGADNRIRDKAQEGAALDDAQQLYASWDSGGLRLAWTGADWDTDGDLFIYLDTQPGGSQRAYDPYPATQGNTTILLPPAGSQQLAVNSEQLAVSGASHRALLEARVAQQAEARMRADYLIWVQDAGTASLLRWDATYETWRAVDGEWGFAFDPAGDAPTTDLYLPFTLLGIGDPTAASLSLAAFASEDDGLRLWATLPARNPVNSPRVLDAVITTGVQQFPLTHSYAWPSLGDGICVNGSNQLAVNSEQSIVNSEQSSLFTASRFTGANVGLSLNGDPAGLAYSVLGDNLFFAMSKLEQFAGSADWDAILTELCATNPGAAECEREPDAASPGSAQTLAAGSQLPSKRWLAQHNLIPGPPGQGGAPLHPLAALQGGEMDFNAQEGLGTLMDVDNPALGDGQEITFTLRYANRGTGPATGLYADVVTWGPMRLPDGTPLSDDQGDYDWLLLPLGDLAAGEEQTITFRGRADLSYDPQNRNGWATIDVVIYDDTGSVYENQLDWLYVDYEYDDRPPVLGISAVPALLGPGENTVAGFVHDRSGVPLIGLEVDGGPAWQCQDDLPDDGAWSCDWDLSGAAEGAVYRLRARGTDEHGQTAPDWSNWLEFTVDATPPVLTLDAATEAALSDGLIGPDETTLSGELADNRLVSGVEVHSPSPLQGEGGEGVRRPISWWMGRPCRRPPSSTTTCPTPPSRSTPSAPATAAPRSSAPSPSPTASRWPTWTWA
ncbi:MAG: proprotein convertase P-domain-containing protein [Ardenticatenaceae bacterium]|nr:proprotein convertase P-domain-containing protein [Ardenticatenaceae bacterium]